MVRRCTEIIGVALLLIVLSVILWAVLLDAFAAEMDLQADYVDDYVDEYIEAQAPQPRRDVEEPAAPQPESLGEFKVTHYCPCSLCCGQWADGITATGTTATEGRTVAVDPDVIPLGSRVRVVYEDGTEAEYIAEDTGGAIHGNRLDVYMDSHQAALEAGVRVAEVIVLN